MIFYHKAALYTRSGYSLYSYNNTRQLTFYFPFSESISKFFSINLRKAQNHGKVLLQ